MKRETGGFLGIKIAGRRKSRGCSRYVQGARASGSSPVVGCAWRGVAGADEGSALSRVGVGEVALGGGEEAAEAGGAGGESAG